MNINHGLNGFVHYLKIIFFVRQIEVILVYFLFLEDTFNLYGLRDEVTDFRKAYEIILDLESTDGIILSIEIQIMIQKIVKIMVYLDLQLIYMDLYMQDLLLLKEDYN